jgi:hypothetical protein
MQRRPRGTRSGDDLETAVLTAVRLHWETVDDLQWSLVQALLNTAQLAPDGCLSWHCRRTGSAVHVSVLWDHQCAARMFTEGRLLEVVQAADLDEPRISTIPLPALHSTGQRPDPRPQVA